MTKRNLFSTILVSILIISTSLVFYIKPTLFSSSSTSLSGQSDIQDDKYFHIKNLLKEKKFGELESYFSERIAVLKNDISIEREIHSASQQLANGDPNHEALLDLWIAEYPESVAAHFVRGKYYHDIGHLYRGSSYYSALSSIQRDKWYSYSVKAEKELLFVLDHAPHLTLAHAVLIFNSAGAKTNTNERIQAAIAARPASYFIQYAALQSSVPKWGGTMEQVELLVDELTKYVEANPKLQPLVGFTDYVNAEHHFKNKEYYQAKQAYKKALEQGDYSTYFRHRGKLHYYVEEYGKAYDDYKRALDNGPYIAENHKNIGAYYKKVGDFDQALAYYNQASAIRPYDYDIHYRLGYLYNELGDFVQAERSYKRALYYTISSGSNAWQNLAIIYDENLKDKQKAKLSYLMALNTNPDSLLNWFNYSTFLSKTKDCDVMLASLVQNKLCEVPKNNNNQYCKAKYLDRNNGILTALPEEGLCPPLHEYIQERKNPLALPDDFNRHTFLMSE